MEIHCAALMRKPISSKAFCNQSKANWEKADQDRGQSRAPFPADRLPEGGSGGSARVVPVYFTSDWTAENAYWAKQINEK